MARKNSGGCSFPNLRGATLPGLDLGQGLSCRSADKVIPSSSGQPPSEMRGGNGCRIIPGICKVIRRPRTLPRPASFPVCNLGGFNPQFHSVSPGEHFRRRHRRRLMDCGGRTGPPDTAREVRIGPPPGRDRETAGRYTGGAQQTERRHSSGIPAERGGQHP